MSSGGLCRCRCKPASRCLQEEGISSTSFFEDVKDLLNERHDQQVTDYHPSKAVGQNDALKALVHC